MGTKNRIITELIYIRAMAMKQYYKASFRMRMKPVAAVCTLPLVKDCSARGRKVGKWMHQYWIQSVLPSKCNGSFSANIRKRLMEGFPSQLDWTQHEVLPWYTHWTVFNSAFWLPNFAVFGMKGKWGRNWVLLYVYQPMELLKEKQELYFLFTVHT